jgi:hypothetical protein
VIEAKGAYFEHCIFEGNPFFPGNQTGIGGDSANHSQLHGVPYVLNVRCVQEYAHPNTPQLYLAVIRRRCITRPFDGWCWRERDN